MADFVAKISKNEALRGIPGTGTEDYGVPYALTEEFVAVYRMHPLVPDDFDFRSARDDAPTLGPRSFTELTGPRAVPILRDQRLTDFTDEVYTPAGMRWIADNTMRSVLARHRPDLEPTVAKLPNAFGIWERTTPR